MHSSSSFGIFIFSLKTLQTHDSVLPFSPSLSSMLKILIFYLLVYASNLMLRRFKERKFLSRDSISSVFLSVMAPMLVDVVFTSSKSSFQCTSSLPLDSYFHFQLLSSSSSGFQFRRNHSDLTCAKEFCDLQ